MILLLAIEYKIFTFNWILNNREDLYDTLPFELVKLVIYSCMFLVIIASMSHIAVLDTSPICR